MDNLKYIIVIILVLSCTAEKNDSPNSTSVLTENGNNTVALTAEQIKAIKLKSGKIQQRSITNVIKANGYLDVPPQNKAVISPMITGYVRKVNFLVGDNVKKGQIMAELESIEFIDLQQQYIEWTSRILYLMEDYDRQKVLRDQDAVSRKKYLLSEVDYKTAKSTLEGLKSKLSLLGVNFQKLDAGQMERRLLLRAPISGSVKKMEKVIGEHVDPSEEIFEIVNPEHLHLELNVYEKDAVKVKKGQKVWFKIPSMQNKIFEGEVFLVGKDLSEDKRSINIHVHIDENQASFTVGMYSNATIVVEENPSYTLPITAVVVDGNTKYIFRKSKNSEKNVIFQKIPVYTGLESDGLIELVSLEGLTIEDEVVTDGAFYLLNAFSEGAGGPD